MENNEFLKFLVQYELELKVKDNASGKAKTASDSISKELGDLRKEIDKLADTPIINPKTFGKAIRSFEDLKTDLTNILTGIFQDAFAGTKNESLAASKAAKVAGAYMGSFENKIIKAGRDLRKQQVKEAIDTENAIQAAREKRKQIVRKRPVLEEKISTLKSAGIDTSLVEKQLKDLKKQMFDEKINTGNIDKLNEHWSKVNDTVAFYFAQLKKNQNQSKEEDELIKAGLEYIKIEKEKRALAEEYDKKITKRTTTTFNDEVFKAKEREEQQAQNLLDRTIEQQDLEKKLFVERVQYQAKLEAGEEKLLNLFREYRKAGMQGVLAEHKGNVFGTTNEEDEFRREITDIINEIESEQTNSEIREDKLKQKFFVADMERQEKRAKRILRLIELHGKLEEQQRKLNAEQEVGFVAERNLRPDLVAGRQFRANDRTSQSMENSDERIAHERQMQQEEWIKKDFLRKLYEQNKAETDSEKKLALERAARLQRIKSERTISDPTQRTVLQSRTDSFIHMAQDPTSNIKAVENAYKALSDTIKQTTEIQKNQSHVLQLQNSHWQQLRKIMYDVQNVTNTGIMYFGAFTAAIVTMFKKVGDQFGKFEEVVNRFKAVTAELTTGPNGLVIQFDEVNATGKRFAETVLKIAENSKFTAVEIAEAGVVMAKLGFTANQVEQSLNAVVMAAEASGESIELVAETISGIINGFGMTADQAQHVADVLTQSALKSATDFKTIAETFKYIAPLARATGQSFEETAGLVSLLGKNMILSSQGGTTLRQALIRLTNITPEAQKQLDALGISAKDTLTGQFKPLKDILVDMSDKMKGLSNSTKLAALSTIFGERAVTGMASALNEIAQNKGAVDQLIAFHTAADGATEAVKEIAFQGLNAELKKLTAQFDNLIIKVGEDLIPVFQTLIDMGKGLIGIFNNMSSGFVAVAGTITAIAGGFGAISLGVLMATKALAGFVQGALVLKGVLEMIRNGTLIATLFSGSMTAAGIAAQGSGALAASGAVGWGALMTVLGPIALVIAGITAALAVGAWMVQQHGVEQDALNKTMEAANETLIQRNKLMREGIEANRKEALGLKLTSDELKRQSYLYRQKAKDMDALAKKNKQYAENQLKVLDLQVNAGNYTISPLSPEGENLFPEKSEDFKARQKSERESYQYIIELNDKLLETKLEYIEKEKEAQIKTVNRVAYEKLEKEKNVTEDIIDMLKRASENAITEEGKAEAIKLLNEEMATYSEIMNKIADLQGKNAVSEEEMTANVQKRFEVEDSILGIEEDKRTKNKSLLDLMKAQNDEREKALELERMTSELITRTKYLKEQGVDTSGLISQMSNDAEDLSSPILKKIEQRKKRYENQVKNEDEATKKLRENRDKAREKGLKDQGKNLGEPIQESDVSEVRGSYIPEDSATAPRPNVRKSRFKKGQRPGLSTADLAAIAKRERIKAQNEKMRQQRIGQQASSGVKKLLNDKNVGTNLYARPEMIQAAAQLQARFSQDLEQKTQKQAQKTEKQVQKVGDTYEEVMKIIGDNGSPTQSSSFSSGSYSSQRSDARQISPSGISATDENREQRMQASQLLDRQNDINRQLKQKQKELDAVEAFLSGEIAKTLEPDELESFKKDRSDLKTQIRQLEIEQVSVIEDVAKEKRKRDLEAKDYAYKVLQEQFDVEKEMAEMTLHNKVDDIMAAHKSTMAAIDEEARQKTMDAKSQFLDDKEMPARLAQIQRNAAEKRKREEKKTAQELADYKIQEELRINDLIQRNQQLRIEMMPDSYKKTIAQIENDFSQQILKLNKEMQLSTTSPEEKTQKQGEIELLNEKKKAEIQKAYNEEQFRQIDQQKQMLDLQYQQNTLLGEFLDISSSIGQTRYSDSLKEAFDSFRNLGFQNNKAPSIARQQIQETAAQFDELIKLDQKKLAETQKQLAAEKEKSEESYQYQALLLQEKQLQQEITNKILAQKQLTSEEFIVYKEQLNALEQVRAKYDQISATIDRLNPAINSIFDGALTTGIANLNKITASMFEVGKNMIDLNAQIGKFEESRTASPKTMDNLFSQWKIDRGDTGGKKSHLGLEESAGDAKNTLENAVNTFVKNIPGQISKMVSAIGPIISAFAPLIIEGLNIVATTFDNVFSDKRVRETARMFRAIEQQIIDSMERINDYLYNNGSLSEIMYDTNKLDLAGKKYSAKVKDIQESIQEERKKAESDAISKKVQVGIVGWFSGMFVSGEAQKQMDKEEQIFQDALTKLNEKEAFLLQEAELEKEQMFNDIYANSFARQSKNKMDLLTANSQAAMTQAQIGQNPTLIAQQELVNAEISIQKQKDDAIEKLIRAGGLKNVRAQEIFIAEMQAINAQSEKNAQDHVNKLIDIDNEYFNRDQQNAKRKVELNRKMSESDRIIAAQKIDLQTELRNIDDKIATEKDPRTLAQLKEERANILADGLQKIKDSAHDAQIQLQLLDLEISGLAANISSDELDDHLNSLSEAFVNIDEKIRDLKIANPTKNFNKFKNDLRLKEIRETNDKIFANDQELKSKEAQANIDSAEVFSQTENSIRMTSNKTTQELIDNLEYLKVKHGENSVQFKSEEKKVQAETLKIAKQTFDGLVGLYTEDLNVYSDIQKMKAEMTADPFDNVLAEFDSASAANQLEQWIVKQQMSNVTDPKQIARLEQKMKQLQTQAESIQKQATRGAGDAAINQLEQIKELREQIFDQETKVYQLDIKKYQREIELKQREIDLKNREKDAILKDLEKQKKAFNKTDKEDFNKIRQGLDFDKELQDALEYISNPLGNLPFKNVDGQMVFEPAGQTAMEAGNKRAEVLKAQAEADFMLENFDENNAQKNAEMYYTKLAQIAAQKAVFAEYAQEQIRIQHQEELQRLTELGKTDDELRIVKNRQKDEEQAAIMYLANAYKEFQDANLARIENSKGAELEAIQEVIDAREDEKEDLTDKLEDSQWEVEKASIKMAEDLDIVEEKMKDIRLATGEWSFTLNQVKNNLPGLVAQVAESFAKIQSDVQSRKIEIPVAFPSEFVTIMRELQALIPRLPQLVSASGAYGGTQILGAQNTTSAQNAAVSRVGNTLYDDIKAEIENRKQYILNPQTGKYEYRLPDQYKYLETQLKAYGFAQGGQATGQIGGTSDYISAMLRPNEIVAPERDFKSLVQDWTYDRMKREKGVVNNGGNNYEFNFGNVYGVDDLKGTIKGVIRDVSKQGGYYNGIYTVNSN